MKISAVEAIFFYDGHHSKFLVPASLKNQSINQLYLKNSGRKCCVFFVFLPLLKIGMIKLSRDRGRTGTPGMEERTFSFQQELTVLYIPAHTRWVSVLICSIILLASFVERADAILCVVDSASSFASPLAICVSLIRSLRNLMDASSATACALGGNWLSNL